jgi:hypothetical protein
MPAPFFVSGKLTADALLAEKLCGQVGSTLDSTSLEAARLDLLGTVAQVFACQPFQDAASLKRFGLVVMAGMRSHERCGQSAGEESGETHVDGRFGRREQMLPDSKVSRKGLEIDPSLPLMVRCLFDAGCGGWYPSRCIFKRKDMPALYTRSWLGCCVYPRE